MVAKLQSQPFSLAEPPLDTATEVNAVRAACAGIAGSDKGRKLRRPVEVQRAIQGEDTYSVAGRLPWGEVPDLGSTGQFPVEKHLAAAAHVKGSVRIPEIAGRTRSKKDVALSPVAAGLSAHECR